MGTNGVSESLTASKAWTQLDRRAILDQLDRMLVSPHFSHSKRYPTLLRYVVEQALAGHSDQIKERVLGIEVFGRASDYESRSIITSRATRTNCGSSCRRAPTYRSSTFPPSR